MNIGSLLEKTSARIKSDNPRLDAQVLTAHALNRSRTWILAHDDADIADGQIRRVEGLMAELERGTPLPYVVGHWEFFGLDLDLTRDVLIPRPETELLVEHALEWLGAHPEHRRVMDVGTGSGCIAIALATRVPDLQVIATDLSGPALHLARANAVKFNVESRVSFLQCDLVPPHPHPLATADHFGLIVANLPYIPTATLLGLPVAAQEPALALDGGPDGLNQIRRLIEQAPAWMAPGGAMFLEIEASQGMTAVTLAYEILSHATIHLSRDLAGHDRLLEILAPTSHLQAA